MVRGLHEPDLAGGTARGFDGMGRLAVVGAEHTLQGVGPIILSAHEVGFLERAGIGIVRIVIEEFEVGRIGN